MANDYFSGLNKYVTQLNNIDLYDDKVDVNTIDSSSISTHVTASDLNTIKDTLSTLVENVNDINSYLISASFPTNSQIGTGGNSNTNINEYLTDDYVRKNQIVVDNHVINDSVIYFDEYYLRHKNIFVDGYKISPSSPYNLISYDQLNLTINGLTGKFNDFFLGLKTQILDTVSSATSCSLWHNDLVNGWIDDLISINQPNEIIFNNILTTVVWKPESGTFAFEDTGEKFYNWYLWYIDSNNQPHYKYYTYGTILPSKIYTKDSNNIINITEPLQSIMISSEKRSYYLENTLNAKIDTNYYLLTQGPIASNAARVTRVGNQLYNYGIRLMGQGFKLFNKPDIIDPAYRLYKWFRVYHKNNMPNVLNISTFYDPQIMGRDIFGNDFPVSSSIQVGAIDPTTAEPSDEWKVYRFGTNDYDLPFYAVNLTDIKDDVKQNNSYGFNIGWMECGGQQRVYAKVVDKGTEGKYVFFSPSAITFPIPFAVQQPIDIQVTLKRDINQPFPGIVPVSVNHEDTYFFDIIGGGQGLENGTSGYFYVKWEAKGKYQMNNIPQLYYYSRDNYNRLHDMYWINNHETNGHLVLSGNEPLAHFNSDDELKTSITNSVANNLHDKFIELLINQASKTGNNINDNSKLSTIILNIPMSGVDEKNKRLREFSDDFGVLTIRLTNTTGLGDLAINGINGYDTAAGNDVITKLSNILKSEIYTSIILEYLKEFMNRSAYYPTYDRVNNKIITNYDTTGYEWDINKMYNYQNCNFDTASSNYFYLTSFILLPYTLLSGEAKDNQNVFSSLFFNVKDEPGVEGKYDSDLYRLRSNIFTDEFYVNHPIPSTKY